MASMSKQGQVRVFVGSEPKSIEEIVQRAVLGRPVHAGRGPVHHHRDQARAGGAGVMARDYATENPVRAIVHGCRYRGAFQGHPTWTHWNVALWVRNDETLYTDARECISAPNAQGKPPSLYLATRRFILLRTRFPERGCAFERPRTPDGAIYTAAAVRRVLSNMRAEMREEKAG